MTRDAAAPSTRERTVTLTVNGATHSARTEVRTLLSDFLRHTLGLTGTHVGCEEGVCGSCTVLLDDVPVRSCLLLAVQAAGARVETVEGLAVDGELTPLQQAFMAEHGLQCGFCTPGILMSLTAAEREGLSEPETADEVLAGHRCRCTGYAGIRAALRRSRAGTGQGGGAGEGAR
ncbi:(2Fe-2S)-binding protein [Streptomyces boncukensis]|uniref:(2Fe-2S)-binding protein n=1 Tax=Streptomyces boncukensis TaxID=2711219 RepID=A0A6G4X5L1_9ACTN|nr:(2Fe-2S)-binding protein [Streptomyces boncukensis]NGO72422.1 (2Fe-2S)-binding protein [Streptomyces boncukensis]